MACTVKYNIDLFYLTLFYFPQFFQLSQTFQSNHMQYWGSPKSNPYPSSPGADAICCMRGFKPFVDLRAALLLVQVKDQEEMSCGWWEFPPCADALGEILQLQALANFSSLVCRLFPNCVGREKCVDVLEADTVLWLSLCWPSHYITRWNRCVCWLQSIGI